MKTMICFENMSYSPFNYEACKEINKMVLESNEEISIAKFDETLHFMDVNTAIFHASELDSFNNGIIITDTIKNAEQILSCVNNSIKVLYLYDLDWMYNKYSYDSIYKILTDKNLKLIVRSEDHSRPITNLCNRRPDAILKNFSLEKIWNSL